MSDKKPKPNPEGLEYYLILIKGISTQLESVATMLSGFIEGRRCASDDWDPGLLKMKCSTLWKALDHVHDLERVLKNDLGEREKERSKQ